MISLAMLGGTSAYEFELHAVVRPALGPAAQVAHVAEHLRQRDMRAHDPPA